MQRPAPAAPEAGGSSGRQARVACAERMPARRRCRCRSGHHAARVIATPRPVAPSLGAAGLVRPGPGGALWCRSDEAQGPKPHEHERGPAGFAAASGRLRDAHRQALWRRCLPKPARCGTRRAGRYCRKGCCCAARASCPPIRPWRCDARARRRAEPSPRDAGERLAHPAGSAGASRRGCQAGRGGDGYACADGPPRAARLRRS